VKAEQNAVAPTSPSLSIARKQLSELHFSVATTGDLVDVEAGLVDLELLLKVLFELFFERLLEVLLVNAVIEAGPEELKVDVGFP